MIDKDDVDQSRFTKNCTTRFNYIEALAYMMTGMKISRDAWTDIQYVHYVGKTDTYDQHIDAHYADGLYGLWALTQRDIFATDWYVTHE